MKELRAAQPSLEPKHGEEMRPYLDELKERRSGVPYRASRCGACYHALYDGYFCQNPECAVTEAVDVVRLTNMEAMILIKAPQWSNAT